MHIIKRLINKLSKRNEISELQKQNDIYKQQIISLQQRLRKYESFNEWEGVEYFADWSQRSHEMSKMIREDCKSLLDLGCGEMHIRKYLDKRIKYYGCDYKKRDDSTIVCDLAKGDFPDMRVDTIFIAGVLEYLTNWEQVMELAAMRCTQIVMSYVTNDIVNNRNDIWVTNLSEQDIIDSISKHGFVLIEKRPFSGNMLFNFERVDCIE